MNQQAQKQCCNLYVVYYRFQSHFFKNDNTWKDQSISEAFLPPPSLSIISERRVAFQSSIISDQPHFNDTRVKFAGDSLGTFTFSLAHR